jgi:anti-anti-sigma factor
VPLLISAYADGATTTVRVAGDIDLGTEPDLWSALEKAIGAAGVDLVVVDLAETGFMDCYGMSALIRGRRLADSHGRRFRLMNVAGIPAIVLKTTGVLDYLDLDHRDLDHRDLDHRDLDHRDLDHRDPDHRDPDHRDPDHRDPDHRDPDHRDPDHRDLDYLED